MENDTRPECRCGARCVDGGALERHIEETHGKPEQKTGKRTSFKDKGSLDSGL